MEPTVRIAFDLSLAGGGDFFTLNDPVKGVLDTGPFGLAGDVLTDVSADVRGVTVRRGRASETTRIDTGTANVILDNTQRKYDPSYKVTQSATGGDTVGTVDVSGVEYVAHEYTTLGTAAFTPGIPLLRGVQVLTDRVNLSPNPSIETNTTTWTIAGVGTTISRITTDAKYGFACIEVTKAAVVNSGIIHASASGQRIAVTPNTTYTYSVYVKVPTGQETCGLRTRINQYTAVTGGTTISTTNGTTVTVTDAQGWVRLTQQITTGATANAIAVWAVQTSAGTAGQKFLVDGVLVEQTSQLRAYFDGGIYDDNTVTATTAWTGTANNSTSTATALQNVGEVTAPFNVNVDTGKVVVRYPQVAFPSPFAPSIIPRKGIDISIAGNPVFSGQVEDWDLQYSMGGDSITSAKSADGFALLAQRAFSASFAGATGLSGSVIYNSASIAGWPLGRLAVDDGAATIGAHTVAADTNVLNYLQEVAGSEPGLLFIGKDGSLTFRDRTASQILTGTVFTDDGNGIGFQSIEIDYGTELLYTAVEVEWTGGKVTAENTVSTEDYGRTSLTVKTLLSTQQQAEDLAEFLVLRYGEPQLRILGLTVEMNGLSSVQQAAMLALELGDGVSIRFTPNGIGDPLERIVVVDSIEHRISPGAHTVALNFSQTIISLVLDDLDLGLLDENTLGF
jgi:hypothetical protein